MPSLIVARPRSRFHSIVTLFAVTILQAAAAAQSGGPAWVVTGLVKDASGALLPNATIDALVAGLTVATTATGADGRYRVELVTGVRHQLRARMNGFADALVDLDDPPTGPRDFVLRLAAYSDEVVVTASRLPERRSTTAESTTVFSARDIETLGSASLADVVRTVPGLNVESNGREGAVASLFARGGESDYNLVLIDGVRVNSNGGAYDFSRVSGSEIDRVEVVRGAQSALYGSDAIGSVVQVFTKRGAPADAPQLAGSIEAGRFDTVRSDAHLVGGVRRRIDFNLGVAYRGTEGAFQEILPEHDRFDQTTVNGGAGGIIGDRATLRTAVRYTNARGKGVGPIAYGARDTGTLANTRDLSWHVDYTHRLAARLHHTASFTSFGSYRLSWDRIADPPYRVFAILTGTPGALFPESPRLVRLIDQPTFTSYQTGAQSLGADEFLAARLSGVFDFASPFPTESEFRRRAFRYQADFEWSDNQTLSGGYEDERESDLLNAAFRIENSALFAQQRLVGRDHWFATVGARLDRNSRYGNNVSPKLSAGGFLLPYRAGAVSSVKVFGSIGRGIKNPLFGELTGFGFSDGNPDLRPERARTLDAGVEATFGDRRVVWRVAYFNNAFNDQVAFKSTGPGLDGRPDFINIDGSEASGWELDAGLQRPIAGGLTATGGYAYVDSRVVSFVSTSEQFQPGQPLLRRPKHAAMLRVTYARGRGIVGLNLRYVGERHDAAFIGLTAVPSPRFPSGRSVDITVNPAYTLVWIGGDLRVSRRASLFARIDNLTDARYESALGYPGLPRSVAAGVRWRVGAR